MVKVLIASIWGIGHKTNNHAEIRALLKAFLIAGEKGIKDIQVFGDAKILIKTLSSNALFNDPLLNKVLQRLRSVMYYFSSHLFYHILHGLNKESACKGKWGILTESRSPEGKWRRSPLGFHFVDWWILLGADKMSSKWLKIVCNNDWFGVILAPSFL